MSLHIVRNDITRMECDAVVNTANPEPTVGRGCDTAIYEAAGREDLLAIRRTIGAVEEGEAFLTPGLGLPARYIIHAVSPLYVNGESGEEEKLRRCYRNSLRIAREQGFRSMAFPLIATGSYEFPREEGLRIAMDEIHAFLLEHEMEIYLVVFGDDAVELGRKIDPDLASYIDSRYVEKRLWEEGLAAPAVQRPRPAGAFRQASGSRPPAGSKAAGSMPAPGSRPPAESRPSGSKVPEPPVFAASKAPGQKNRVPGLSGLFGKSRKSGAFREEREESVSAPMEADAVPFDGESLEDLEDLEKALQERIDHRKDTFSQYLMYLIESKDMKAADVYRRALVDKKAFSKIKNNPQAHPQKITALCLCIGAKLGIDEARDLLARAGYALSPSDKTDIIFAYFLERGIYDMIELDIQLENHGLPCLIA